MERIPLVLFEGNPMPENDQGIFWVSVLFHVDGMVRALNNTLSDFLTASRKGVIAATIFEQSPDVRVEQAATGKPEEKVVKDNETFNIWSGEKVYQMETAQVNSALIQFIGMVKGFLDQQALSRPALVGGMTSGQSAVALQTAAQRSEAELKASHESLQSGAEEECILFFAAVRALNWKFPKSPDAVEVVPASDKYGREMISVTPEDTEGYDMMIQADLRQNIPVDEGAMTTNYAVVTKSGGLSHESARERYLQHGDPVGEQDKIDRGIIRNAIIQAIAQVAVQRAMGGVEQVGAMKGQEMAQMAQGVNPTAQEVAASFIQESDPEMANMLRGQMNEARTGRGQQTSQLAGMNTSV
jgi:hypothetical protein